MPSSSKEILERLNAAAQRGLGGPTLTAYRRRIWRNTLIRVAFAGLDPGALPQARAGFGEQWKR